MSASEAQICNLALIKFGEKTITALTDDTKEGRACKVLYPLMRDEMLYSHPWNFAMRRADISGSVVDTPAFGYDYAYTLPPGCLRVWELVDDSLGNSGELWEVEGNTLLTDRDENIYIRYISQVTQTGYFNPAFVNCLAIRLAAELAVKLAESKSMRAELLNELDRYALPAARRLNAMEGNKKQHKDQQPLDNGNFSWQDR